MGSYVMSVYVTIETMGYPYCPLYGSVEETLAEIDKQAGQLYIFRIRSRNTGAGA